LIPHIVELRVNQDNHNGLTALTIPDASVRRGVRIRCPHGDQWMFLHAGLELAHHLQHRPDDPAIRDLLVRVLARVGVEVEQERDRELDRGRNPVGDYSPARLANTGIGHGAIDLGGAYTYLNPATGNEFSATAGFTYNFKNPDTQYRNGIDFHFDWGAAHFISKQVFIGVAGYAYQQITDDSGQSPILGGFRSRVLGIGPQIGYAFPLGDMQGFLGLRGYGEFDAANRAPGWSTWLTFAISPAEPTVAKPVRQRFTK
jgi:hypothetical protein